ncbi:hypothetical protein M514_28189 [Trichuris suis]|uniref:EGF-like domain-containing protein n=1 Tax=Trichuris suis TaxID=68888 RepID=A0A085MQY5_9BILA|nr:hypothetical protein M514_28189 [Trichuris suis]
MKVKVTLLIYSLFTVEVVLSDSLNTEESYREIVKKECKEMFEEFPVLNQQYYDIPRFTQVHCKNMKEMIHFHWRMRRYIREYTYFSERKQYGTFIMPVVSPPFIKHYHSFCDINEPILHYEQFIPIDCGPFDDNCRYRRLLINTYAEYLPRMYMVIDGARIVKRIKRVIKGTINYRVTLILSLGNGTYMNLNYTVKAFSYVEINQTDPFYFTHDDLLRLYRETQFPLCIYRAWDTVHSQYYPCSEKLPKKYYWDKTINDWNKQVETLVVVFIKRMLPKYDKQRNHTARVAIRSWMYRHRKCAELVCPKPTVFFPAYNGYFCEQNIDECAFNVHKCPPGWECRDTNTSYYCECPAGTTGTNCSQDVDECEEGTHDCPIYSTCRNTNGSYTCICPSWFTGKYCNEFIDYCIIYKPCRNGGKCHPLQNNYHCECPAGYTGKNCTDDIDECHSNPCGTHGTCENGVNKYTCKCEPAYTGWRCDVEINECKNQNLQCKHGICVRVEETKYKCDCHPGYTGRLCDTDIDECLDKSICGWNGNCRNEVGSFKCECLDGFRGDRCQHEIDECQSDPCQNGGYCLDGRNDYECICQLGYKGTHCEHIIDHCKSHECENEGSCINLPYGYRCDCPSYATGTFCEDLIDNCVDEYQCGEGYCRNLKGSYECICDDGYTDKNCKTKVDRCADIECRNGGRCTSDGEDYSCICPKGTRGFYCETKDSGMVARIHWKMHLFASLFLAWRHLF